MKYTFPKFNLIMPLLAVLAITGCGGDDEVAPMPLDAELVENLPADPTQNQDLSPKTPTNQFTFFSLKDNAVVANSDSATAKWDIGFRSTTIIVNGGTSGPGQAQAQIVTGIFDEFEEAPESGYASDDQGTFAIQGNGGWYNYTGQAGNPVNAIIAIPGKIIVIKTANGRYAKLEILSYYYGNPDTSTSEFANMGTRPAARYMTFHFVYQPDGSRNLKETQ